MRRNRTAWLLVLSLLTLSAPAAAWHGSGHSLATRKALTLLDGRVPEFLTVESAPLVAHASLDPDLFTRPIGSDRLHEATAAEHYFDLEVLDGAPVPPQRYELIAWCVRNDVPVKKMGLLPYAICESVDRLAVAFAEHRRWPDDPHIRLRCCIYAGHLAHFAEDLCMPLHTTIHYDGLVGDDGEKTHRGIHMKLDALLGKLGDDTAVEADAGTLAAPKDVFDAVVAELGDSHALVGRVYELADEIPAYEEPLDADGPARRFAEERLRASAIFTARLIEAAWQQSAGIELPAWHERPARQGGARPGSAAATPATAGPSAYHQNRPADIDPPAAGTERVRIATWNIEHFMRMFDQIRMPDRSQDRSELFRDEEDLFEVAAVLGLDRFDPDIVVLQECCSQEMLELFNRRWLDGRYAFVKVFRGNVEGQWLGILARAGFEVLDVREEYYLTKDPRRDPAVESSKRHAGLAEQNLLFSRGPAFVLFRTPGGRRIWVGCTHVKSKYGNSEAVTAWRIREVEATRRICADLLAEGKTDLLVIGGDFNDEFGLDSHEKALGRDAVAAMLEGEPAGLLTCPTRGYQQRRPAAATYHCRIKPAHWRSFIDHLFCSQPLADAIKGVVVIDEPVAAAASDHLPVLGVFDLPGEGD
jgi:endonuclease/exonuclease/phosphatase family metal-dependent hydrolase